MELAEVMQVTMACTGAVTMFNVILNFFDILVQETRKKKILRSEEEERLKENGCGLYINC